MRAIIKRSGLNMFVGMGSGFLGADKLNAVRFDGTNDYLARGADLTGQSNGKVFTASFWMYQTAIGNENILAWGSSKTRIQTVGATNKLSIIGLNAGDTANVLSVTSDALSIDQWNHIAISIDMASASNRHIYVNGVDAFDAATTYTNADINFTYGDVGVGGNPNGTNKLSADIAQLWFDDQYIDLSVSTNLEKFYDSGVVELGVDGSNPTGAAPLIFLNGNTDKWHTNKGTGGGFTENGALTKATRSPSD